MALEKTTLDNGLTVYNDRVPGAWNNDVTVFVPYGSVDEQSGHEGVAHVFEHCVHLETDDFSDRSALQRYETKHGMLTNANTAFTRTLYYANGLDLEPNMHYLSQILQHTHFPEDAVEHELKAVRREMAMHLDSAEEAHEYAAYNATFGLPYGRSIGGYHDKIDFDVDTLKDLHSKYYKLGNMALIVSGKAKLDEVVQLANQYFQADEDGSFQTTTPPPAVWGEHRRTGLVRDDSHNVQMYVSYPMSSEFRDKFNERRIEFGVAQYALAMACFERMRYDKGISYDGSIHMSTDNHPNAWSIVGGVTVDAENVSVASEVFDETFRKRGSDFGDEELQGILAQHKHSVARQLQNTGVRIQSHVNNLEAYREPKDVRKAMRKLDTVKTGDIRRAIDEIADYAAVTPQYTHLTGTRAAIGDVERVIDQSEIA